MPNPAAFLQTDAQRASIDTLSDQGDGKLYVMDYTADYRLDDVLAADIRTVPALIEHVRTHLLTGGAAASGVTDAGCSAFSANTPDGGRLCGRNYDRRTDTTAVLLRTRPADAYASLSLVDTGRAGYGAGSLADGTADLSMAVSFPYLAMDGMNEHGLFVSVLKLDGAPVCQDTGKPKALMTVLMRLALDRAKAVGEAVALLAAYDMQTPGDACGFHFLLADAAGRTAVVEYIDRRMHVLDASAATGFSLRPPVTDGGADGRRFAVIRTALDCRGSALTRTDAMSLLRLVRQDGADASERTQWSAVYDLTARAVDIAVRCDYTRVYHFSLYGNLCGMWT